MSLRDYLAFEEQSIIKHEYVAGEVYAMSGVTIRHGRIALNIAAHLRAAARVRRCAIVLSEVKLRVAADRFYYPDLIIACGYAADVELIIEEPSLIAEVTSPSTRATDRREKLDAYLKIPSLRVYLVVDQRRRHVLAYVRDPNGEWQCDELQGTGEIVIPFLDARLTLDQVYEDVTLPPLSVKEGEEWDAAEWADYEATDA
jgi:Uma2 family endonuclease